MGKCQGQIHHIRAYAENLSNIDLFIINDCAIHPVGHNSRRGEGQPSNCSKRGDLHIHAPASGQVPDRNDQFLTIESAGKIGRHGSQSLHGLSQHNAYSIAGASIADRHHVGEGQVHCRRDGLMDFAVNGQIDRSWRRLGGHNELHHISIILSLGIVSIGKHINI